MISQAHTRAVPVIRLLPGAALAMVLCRAAPNGSWDVVA